MQHLKSVLKVPKPTPQSKRPLADIVYFPNTPGYQLALWQKLADIALHRRTARRKHLLQ
jgi:hypothetical protein